MIKEPVAITLGEPAGIGPDIVACFLQKKLPVPVVVIGDGDDLLRRAELLSLKLQLKPWDGTTLPKEHKPGEVLLCSVPLKTPSTPGCLNRENSESVLAQLSKASELALSKKVSAVITAPVNKSIMNEAGFPFVGQTEFFAEKAHVKNPVMMLANEHLRVALVTTHLPLSKVPGAITQEAIRNTVEVTQRGLQEYFGISHPRFLVCGLNPHAGESGYLGREEIDIINPALRHLQEKGFLVSEALPADTVFTPDLLANAHGVVAMYHDQGLPVVKSLGFGKTVNITLGLPFLRVSVDHGTALSLAGTGQARMDSLMAAYECVCNALSWKNSS